MASPRNKIYLPISLYTWIYLLVHSATTNADGGTYLGVCDDDLQNSQYPTTNIVFPIRLIDSQPVNLSTYNPQSQSHEDSVTMAFLYGDELLIMKLKQNAEVLNRDMRRLEANQATESQKEDDCFYQGFFEQSTSSDDYVTLSTCDGIRGALRIKGSSYSIRPLSAQPKSTGVCVPHMLSELTEPGGGGGGVCNNKINYFSDFKDLHRSEFYRQLSRASHSKRLVSASDASWVRRNLAARHLKLALVVDSALAAEFANDPTEIRGFILGLINLIDLYYQRVNVRVSLIHHSILPASQEQTITSNPIQTIQNLLSYSKAKQSRVKYDVLHVLSGRSFDNDSIGMAIPSSVCTDRSIAIISARKLLQYNHQRLATIISHMIGHNIGLEHDSDIGCSCDDVSQGCIMGEGVVNRMELLSRVNLGYCLTDGSNGDGYPQICGNGVIERGEQCDCGPLGACDQVDRCCNASTCLLKAWATCRTGPCCDNCMAKSTQSICRSAQNDCDAPEFCDGFTGQCPANQFIQDGQPCGEDNSAFCYQGICPSRDMQCKLIWGDDSRSADMECYRTNNLQGYLYGHCGQTVTGSYKPCPQKDALCGLLQCDGGEAELLIPGIDYRRIYSKSSSEDEVNCKIINGGPASDQYNKGLVSDGTKCGDNHLCQSSVCTPIGDLNIASCPQSPYNNLTCSGHGRCTTAQRCSCYPGFDGEICEFISPTKRIDASTLSPPVSVPDIVPVATGRRPNYIVLGAVLGAALLALIPAAVIVLHRRGAGCFHPRKKRIGSPSTYRGNRPATRFSASPDDVQFDSVVSYNNNGGVSDRRRRRRRRRHRPSSSEESSANEDDLIAPAVIYDVISQISQQPPKGILKKPRDPRELDSPSDCSDSQCSCGGNCSSCSETEDLQLVREDSIPVPQIVDVHAELEPRLSNNSNLHEHNQQDSATDSAIDLPHGDSSVSTLSDSAACCQISPLYSNRASNLAPSLQTITASINSSSNTLSATTADHLESKRHDRTSSTARPKSESYCHNSSNYIKPRAVQSHRTSVDSLNGSNFRSSNENLVIPKPDELYPTTTSDILISNPDYSYIRQVSPCSLETDVLIPRSANGKLECMYSLRPDPGPMRTFRPINNP